MCVCVWGTRAGETGALCLCSLEEKQTLSPNLSVPLTFPIHAYSLSTLPASLHIALYAPLCIPTYAPFLCFHSKSTTTPHAGPVNLFLKENRRWVTLQGWRDEEPCHQRLQDSLCLSQSFSWIDPRFCVPNWLPHMLCAVQIHSFLLAKRKTAREVLYVGAPRSRNSARSPPLKTEILYLHKSRDHLG